MGNLDPGASPPPSFVDFSLALAVPLTVLLSKHLGVSAI